MTNEPFFGNFLAYSVQAAAVALVAIALPAMLRLDAAGVRCEANNRATSGKLFSFMS